MLLKKVEIDKYRNLENIEIYFEKNQFSSVFSIASINGGGKTTILQFIFTLLHCFTSETKKVFIKNILGNNESVDSCQQLANFTIEHKDTEYKLEFFITPCLSDEKNFNLYLDLKETDIKIQENKKLYEKNREILSFKKKINESNRVTPLLEKNLICVREFINNRTDERLYREAKNSNDIQTYRKLMNSIIDSNNFEVNRANDLESIYSSIQENILNLENILKEEDLLYITHLSNIQNVLLLKTNMPKDLLEKLSNKIFLTAPSSQIYLFLPEEEKTMIFNNFPEKDYYYNSYENNVQSAKNRLDGFFTYDFVSVKFILKSFEKAFEEDKKIKIKTGSYGSHYDDLSIELNNFLEDKEIIVDENEKVIFRLKGSKQELAPEDLSHGELKKLSIYIWLKYIVGTDSIILMDEVDIALHPKWQYEIIKDLTAWSKNSQFLLATHSPQILSSTYYKNLIKLEIDNDKIKVKRYTKPPLDRDINSIITTIMDAPDFPDDLLELHKKYRKLVRDDKIDSEDAKQLKEEILEYESENSSFFQDINFDLELM